MMAVERSEHGVVPQILRLPVCPGCGRKNESSVERTIAPDSKGGVRVQYRKCRSCGTRFKTVVQ